MDQSPLELSDPRPARTANGEFDRLLADPAFCEALRQRVRDGLEVAKIILGSSADPQTVSAMESLAQEGVIRLYRSSQPQTVHFMVMGHTVIVEYGQSGTEVASDQSVTYDDRRIAALLERRFDAIIESGLAQPFLPDHEP